MGMRAIIAYENANGTVKVTTNQWSTVIHNVVNDYMSAKVSRGVGFEKAASVLFRHITKYAHVSNIDIRSADEVMEMLDFLPHKMVKLAGKVGKNEHLYIDGPWLGMEDGVETFKNVDSLDELVRNHFHAQDGISMYYSEKEPGVINFYIDEDFQECPAPLTVNNI